MKTQLPLYSDTLFTYLATFFIAVCLFTYLGFPVWAVLSASGVASLGVSVVAFLVMRARLEAKYLLKKDEETKSKLMIHLTLGSAEQARRLISKLLRAEGNEVQRRNGALLVGEKLIFLLFSMSPVSADEIAKIIRRETTAQKVVYCNELSPEAKKLCGEFQIETECGRDLYLRLKAHSLLPKSYLCPNLPKKTLKEKIGSFFRRNLAKPYFLGGIGLLSYSFFTPYKIYYLVVGSLLIGLSLSLRLFGSKR